MAAPPTTPAAIVPAPIPAAVLVPAAAPVPLAARSGCLLRLPHRPPVPPLPPPGPEHIRLRGNNETHKEQHTNNNGNKNLIPFHTITSSYVLYTFSERAFSINHLYNRPLSLSRNIFRLRPRKSNRVSKWSTSWATSLVHGEIE